MTPRGSPSAGGGPWEAQGTTSEGWENGVGERGTSSALIHDSEEGPRLGLGVARQWPLQAGRKVAWELGWEQLRCDAAGRASDQGEAPSLL